MTPNGTAIMALRQVQSLTLRRLAELAETSASQLSRIERGKSGAGDDLLYRLAAALHVPIEDIIRGAVMPTRELVAPEGTTEDEVPKGTTDANAPMGTAESGTPEQGPPKGVPKKLPVPRQVPYPGTDEGSYFHYTPEEAAQFLPWSGLQLKRKAYAREIPFNDGGKRVSFTGLDIRKISAMTAVRPLAEAEPVQQRAAS
ncbi:helix-turn-helix domain-containing protein [Streptomyces niveus]|uniref:helix-turn-helix domain-containing protein n=1 Tax=Streptomyces niveus TaxID=193462 RepID=UPI0036E9B5FC